MATRRIEKDQWKNYFEFVSRHLEASRVDILVEGLDIGVQVEAQRTPLLGLSYDPKNDVLDVLTEHVGHTISSPREIYVEESAGLLNSFEVTDGAGHKQIIELSKSLALPPPSPNERARAHARE